MRLANSSALDRAARCKPCLRSNLWLMPTRERGRLARILIPANRPHSRHCLTKRTETALRGSLPLGLAPMGNVLPPPTRLNSCATLSMDYAHGYLLPSLCGFIGTPTVLEEPVGFTVQLGFLCNLSGHLPGLFAFMETGVNSQSLRPCEGGGRGRTVPPGECGEGA